MSKPAAPVKVFAMCENGSPIADTALCTPHYLQEENRKASEEKVSFDRPGLVLWEEAHDPELACFICGTKADPQ